MDDHLISNINHSGFLYNSEISNSYLNVENMFSYRDNSKYSLGKINTHQVEVYTKYNSSIILISKIDFNDPNIFYYLGCYYADGTTSINSATGICASTREQAEYFLKMYTFLIGSPNLAFYIRYTKLANDSRTDQEISKELTNYWQTLPNIVLKYTNIRFSSSTKYNSREKTKINEYGTLEIRDYRKIIKEFYVILMEKAISFLLNSRSKHLIWSFILGFLEGDGSVHTNKRRHFYIRLAANSNNVIILKQMLQIIGIQCSVDESMLKKNGKGVRIQIQILQILKNLNIIAPKIFLYYPKRRKMFVENFFKNRSVQYLIGSKIELGKQYVAKNFLDKEIIINPAIMAEIRLLEKELNNYGLTIAQLIDNLKN